MSNTLRRLVASGATVALATVGVQVLATGAAFAHAVAVKGSAACQSDGTYTVTWTIANEYESSEVSTVTHHTPDASTLTASSVRTDAYESATISQAGIASNAGSASLTVSSFWSDEYGRHNHGSVELEGNCRPGHAPAAPTWSDGTCSAHAAVLPSITIPSDSGVTYRIDRVKKDPDTYSEQAGSYTVKARSKSYALTGTTSWTFQLGAGPTDCTEAAVPISPVLTQSSCVDGSPTAPSLVQLGNDGVAYTVSADGPYSGGQAVTVTAKAQTGYEFTTVPSGWALVDSTTATYLVTFAATPTCVTPQTPLVTQSSCAAGAPSAPSLAQLGTDGIAYTVSADGPYSGGQAVTVTAKAQTGYEFTAAPTGWSLVNSTTATYLVTFAAAPNCAAATAPSFVDDTCAAFAATGASYTIPTVAGVDYYVGDTKATAGTHTATDATTTTITTQPQPGYTLTGDASWTHTFTATPTCTTAVTPSAVTFTDDACAGSGTTGSSYTIPTVAGVDYYVGDTKATAGTHTATDATTTTITTQPQPGYTLTGDASWTHTFTATPTCSGIEGVTVTRPPHQVVAVSARQQPTTLTPVAGLASTGAPVRELLLVGAALLLLGVGCIAMATGRRRSQG